jgi:hypothetical protein
MVAKTLGGTNGNLKCEQCGKPRYPRVKLCTSCYYANHKWYGISGHWEFIARSDGDTELGTNALVKTKAISLDHALSKFNTGFQWICCMEHIVSTSEREVDAWLDSKKDANSRRTTLK